MMNLGIMKRSVLIAGLALLILVGCNSFKKENVQPPTPLDKNFKPLIELTKVWHTRVGKGAGASGIRLRPAVADGVLYADSADGTVAAFDAATGKKLWSVRHGPHGWFGWGDKKRQDAFYAGGPVVSGDLLVVGTLDGHVYGMNAKDGTPRWTATLNSEVLAAPVIDGSLVMVRTSDGRIYGLDKDDGQRRWAYDQGTVPLLSLRGNGPLLVTNGVVFYGGDDGKLVALREDTGDKLWEQALASGNGRTEIERLDDADDAILLDGATLYGAAYHGNLSAIDGPSGRPLWSRPFSTFTSLSQQDQALYGVDDESNVWAFAKNGGSDLWKNEQLKHRWLSGTEVQGAYVVVGDLEGYVHWLKTDDGALAGRVRLSSKAIRAQPLVVGDLVYVEDVVGHLSAYRIAPRLP